MLFSGFFKGNSAFIRTLICTGVISVWLLLLCWFLYRGAVVPAIYAVIAVPILQAVNVQSGRMERYFDCALFNALVFFIPLCALLPYSLMAAGCAVICGAAGSALGWTPRGEINPRSVGEDLVRVYTGVGGVFLWMAIGGAALATVGTTITNNEHHCDVNRGTRDGYGPDMTTEYNDKPVIYLYPERSTPAIVQVEFNGTVEATYPRIGPKNTWNVTAHPDGRIQDSSGEYHRYLFWEGRWGATNPIDRNEGFLVRGGNVDHFLRGKLRKLGLNSLETDDFITYWYPILRKRKLLHIYFSQLEYGSAAQLNVTPRPDSQIRFLMVFRDAPEGLKVTPQKLIHHARRGFTLVEWGGMELKKDGEQRVN